MTVAGYVFLSRTFVILVLCMLALWSAGAHAGLLIAPGSLHTPLVADVLALAALLAAGFPLYRSAYLALLHAEINSAVLAAFLTSTLAVVSIFMGMFVPSATVDTIGFLIATTIAAGWFLARSGHLYILPWLRQNLPSQPAESVTSRRPLIIPILAGLAAALLMIAVYLSILSLLQSPAHAVEQLLTDGIWVGLVAFGFGVQIGLYTFLRLLVRAARASRATVVTGAGTSTSTLGMLACCAHHLSDIAPLVALTGAGGLSGVVGILTEWKYAFVGLGLLMNLFGSVMTVRTIRSCRGHQATMTGVGVEAQPAPACH